MLGVPARVIAFPGPGGATPKPSSIRSKTLLPVFTQSSLLQHQNASSTTIISVRFCQNIDKSTSILTIFKYGRSIVVTSGKGVGKQRQLQIFDTGCRLKEKGRLVDTDIGLRNLDVILGLENRVCLRCCECSRGNLRTPAGPCQRQKAWPQFCAAAQTRRKEDISNDQLKQIVTALKGAFDYVILDCPAGIEHGFNNAVNSADEAVVVVTPEVSSVRDADRVIGLLESAGVNDISLVVNRIKPEMVSSGEMMSVEDVLDILAVRLLGVIPRTGR